MAIPAPDWGHGIPAEFVVLIGQLCHAPVNDVVFHFLTALQLLLQFLELILQTLDFQLPNLMADLKLLLSYLCNLLSQRLAFLTFRASLPELVRDLHHLLLELVIAFGQFGDAWIAWSNVRHSLEKLWRL